MRPSNAAVVILDSKPMKQMKSQTKPITTIALAFLLITSVSSEAQRTPTPNLVLVSTSRASVTFEDLTAELERLPEENRADLLLNKQRLAKLLDNLLVAKTMATEAEKNGLQKQPRVAAEIRNGVEKTLSKYRREEIEANAPKIDLLPLARELFVTRLRELQKPAMYTSWHTLIKLKDRTREAATERAQLVKSKVDAGELLEPIAKKFSDDESVAINGGNIDPTPLENFDNAYATALAKLKVGESTIVETAYGIHVVRLMKMIPRYRPTFDEVKPAMIDEADKAYKQRIVDTYLNEIRNDPTLKVNVEAIDSVRPKLPEVPPPASARPVRPF